MTNIFRLKFNDLAAFEKTVFVTSWSKECHVMLGMNFPKLYLCGTLYLDPFASKKGSLHSTSGVFLAFQPMP